MTKEPADVAIAVLPYGRALGPALGSVPVSDLIWPLGMPERLEGKCVGDMRGTDHLIVFPKTSTHFVLRRGTRARISLVLGEPSIIHAKHIRMLRLTHRRFHRILTFNADLLGRLPNAVFFPLGTTWVPEWSEIDLTKTRHMSLIASAKRDSEGHKLRHSMVEFVRSHPVDCEVMGRGYTPFEAKAEGLAPFRFSVVIENVREKNYFSEKLVDAVLCDTVPIYWGCPNIAEFVDTSGMMICKNAEDMRAAILSASEAGYDARLPALRAIKPDLLGYCDLERRAALAIRASL